MGRRGPKPTPTAILRMRGSTLVARRESEPQPAGRGSPEMPRWLMPVAKTIWKRLVPELESMGVLTTADGDALARYCQALAHWRRAQQVLARKGMTYETKTTEGHPCVKPRPEVAIARSLSADLNRLEASFGLNPSARAGLAVTAIYTPGRKTSDTTPSSPIANPDPKAPNIIDGKGRFFN